MRHCTPADEVLVAVLEGGVGATVAGAAAISIAAATIIAIGPPVAIAFDVALFSRAVKQLHEVVPKRFNTWLLAAHRYFGKGFDDQALVVADAAKEKGRVIHPFGKGFQFREHFTQGIEVKIVPGDFVAHIVGDFKERRVFGRVVPGEIYKRLTPLIDSIDRLTVLWIELDHKIKFGFQLLHELHDPGDAHCIQASNQIIG